MRGRFVAGAGLAGLSAALALAVGGCGSDDDGGQAVDLRPGVVAKVGSAVVTKQDFDTKLKTVAATAGPRGTQLLYEPLDVSGCVATATKTNQIGVDAARFGCEQEAEQFRIRAMQAALHAEWLRQEASRLDVRVPKAEDRAAIERQVQARFRTPAGYRRFLQDAGLKDEEFRAGVRTQTLTQQISLKVKGRAREPSQRDVEEYYASHRNEFFDPERRDVRMILARSEATARQSMQALARGQDWGAVAARYSIDPDTKGRGGDIRGLTRSGSSKELTGAAFDAKAGVLEGPVESQFGWYVFEVQRIRPGVQRSLERAYRDILTNLFIRRRDRVINRYGERWTARYTARTTCDEDFKIAECANGPAANPVPTAPAATTPQPSQ